MIATTGVLVPTYERPHFVHRQLDWLNSLGITDVVVADGSRSPAAVPKQYARWYRHYPGTSMMARLKLAIEELHAPVLTICADDDYLAPEGLARASELVLGDTRYASAQARYISLERRWASIRFGELYAISDGYDVVGDTPRARLEVWMKRFMHSIYAVRRRERMLHIIRALPLETPNGNLIELAFAFGDAWFGEHKLFADALYMARETQLTAGATVMHEELSSFRRRNQERYELWSDAFCAGFAQQVGATSSEIRSLWEFAIETYSASQPRALVRKWLPARLRNLIKVVLPVRPPAPALLTADFHKIREHAHAFATRMR